jgi:succinate dehydrogenase/fumarate reductase flavoprotein subunit
VCGAGMAGLCAGAAAALAGARTAVIEKGSDPGGSMRMSGGTVWTAPTMAVMETLVPGGDRDRQRQLVDGLTPGLVWLEGLGIELGAVIANDHQVGREVSVVELTERLVAAIKGAGGDVRTGVALDGLVVDTAGRVAGVDVAARGGRRSRIAARAVILATGGFGGSTLLLERYVSANASTMLRRANPHSTGDGLNAGLAAGAGTSSDMAGFYGHTMPISPDLPPAAWTSVTQYASGDAILVNEQGNRFFDESTSLADERAAMAIVDQPGGRAFMVLDRRIYEDRPIDGRSQQPMARNFDRAVASGAPALVAPTLPALADGLAAWGVSPRGFLATVAEFNTAIGRGDGAALSIPRRGAQFGLVEPPFRALAVRAGMTFTLGGLAVDQCLRVLDRDGRPIDGLFAAGADAGGTYSGGYAGGLVLGLVQGRLAGESAARDAAREQAARA